MTTPNVALLRLTLGHIEMAPCTWDQGIFRAKDVDCGTVMCFAGWACTLAGGHWYTTSDSSDHGDLLVPVEDDLPADVRPRRGVPVPVVSAFERASRVLGLTFPQAQRLFDASNDLDDLRWLVDEICAGVAA